MKTIFKFLRDNKCNISINGYSENEFQLILFKGTFYESTTIRDKSPAILINHVLMQMLDNLHQRINASKK